MSKGSHQEEAAENLDAIKQVRGNLEAARELVEEGQYEPAIDHLTAVIEVNTHTSYTTLVSCYQLLVGMYTQYIQVSTVSTYRCLQ